MAQEIELQKSPSLSQLERDEKKKARRGSHLGWGRKKGGRSPLAPQKKGDLNLSLTGHRGISLRIPTSKNVGAVYYRGTSK